MGVVIYHAAPRASGYDFPLGRAGVELFFVISGFIMATIWDRSDRFMLRRAARILPLYWIVASITAVTLIAAPGISKSHPDILGSFLLLPTPSGSRVLEVAWTLTNEMFFYALLAMLPRRHALWAACCIIGSLVVLGLFVRHANSAIVALTNPMNLCFIAGIVIAKMQPAKRPMLAICAAALWFCGIYASKVADSTEAYRALWFGVPATLLLYGAVSIEWRAQWLERIGDSSYSLYLIHIPAMKAAALLSAALALGAPGIATLIAFSVAAGLLTHSLIERPLMRGAKSLCEARFPTHISRQRAFE